MGKMQEQMVGMMQGVVEEAMSRMAGRAVGHACDVARDQAGGLHLGAGGPLNSHLVPFGTSGEEKEEEQESE